MKSRMFTFLIIAPSAEVDEISFQLKLNLGGAELVACTESHSSVS